MDDLLLVTGPPGAGRSTIAGLLARRFERSALVSGDAFFAFLQSGFTDEDAARHMHRQFAGAEIDRRHLFVDPPDAAEAVVDHIVAAVANGSVSFQPSA